MKVVIFAGGRGTRLEEETKGLIPKPMVSIGDRAILAHIIGIYSAHGSYDFIVAAGYLAEQIENWRETFPNADYYHGESVRVHRTGTGTQTGGRIKRLEEHLGERFMLTYGDGLADINILALLDFHERMRKQADIAVTLTAVRPPGRWGALEIHDGLAQVFTEKSQLTEGWINGGFYVVEPEVFRSIAGDQTNLELDVLPSLATQGRLAAYRHTGWWMGMDTPRDKDNLEALWERGMAPWARLLK